MLCVVRFELAGRNAAERTAAERAAAAAAVAVASSVEQDSARSGRSASPAGYTAPYWLVLVVLGHRHSTGHQRGRPHRDEQEAARTETDLAGHQHLEVGER